MDAQYSPVPIPYDPSLLVEHLQQQEHAVLLLYGEAGMGKSTLAARLAASLWDAAQSCYCLSGDPGSPEFGPPGAVSFGVRQAEGWKLLDFEPLCSLDAVRYRLPLTNAERKLCSRQLHRFRRDAGKLIVDTPGVVAGAAGEELLSTLLNQLPVTAVCYLTREPVPRLLSALTPSSGMSITLMQPAPGALPLSKSRRAEARSRAWQGFMVQAREIKLPLSQLTLLGMGTELGDPDSWQGRQCALYADERLLAMGEVLVWEDDGLRLKLRHRDKDDAPEHANRLLVRDAVSSRGKLRTSHFTPVTDLQRVGASDWARHHRGYNPRPPRGGDPVSVRLGSATATLINGIFGDPLLHVHLTNQRRHLLFDLGESSRLPTRVIHQTSDIFFSHAHADHIGGFLWFLRSRIGYYPCCRIFGPPGIALNIAGLVQGLLWDRVEDRAPQFDVAELRGDHLECWRIVAGESASRRLADIPVADGIILSDPAFTVKAVVLEHGMGTGVTDNGTTPVLAYSLKLSPHFNVSREKLAEFTVSPGPWLQDLKHGLKRGELDSVITLPDGTSATVETLAERLLVEGRTDTLVYATDLADVTRNREALVELARDCDLFFCEAPYCLKDEKLAKANGHLTTRACGELASAAQVKKLVPFHFSKRYEGQAETVYREIKTSCAQMARTRRGSHPAVSMYPAVQATNRR